MAFEVIRLSPSGAPIKNVEGGVLQPGPGMPIRAVDVTTPLDGSDLSEVAQDPILDSGAAEIVLELTNPDPNLRYSAECEFELLNQTGGNGVATIQLEVSYDGGSTWEATPLCAVDHTVRANGNFAESRLVSAHVPITLGSALAAAMPAAAPSIQIRPTAQATAQLAVGVGGANGSFYMKLTEHM